MSTEPQIIITGYPSFDRIMRVSHKSQIGETSIILDPPGITQPAVGGCVNNIAVTTTRLGVKATPVIVIGDDHDGLKMHKILQEEGVDISCIQHIKKGKTAGAFLFINPDNSHQTFYYPGVADINTNLNIPPLLFKNLSYGVITVGNPHHTRAFVETLKQEGIPLVWSLRNDQHAFPRSLIELLINSCKIITMNEFEEKQLLKIIGASKIESLFKCGVRIIIVTKGASGSMIMKKEGNFSIPSVSVNNVKDPTGAGDAFVGGFLAGLCYKTSIETAAKIGAVTSSFVLEELGSQTNLPSKEQMISRFEKAYKEKLQLELLR